jgi:mannose-1-phosphate guanylyltransferase
MKATKQIKRFPAAERDCTSAWAVLLAGGDGTRLQSLTLKIEGDLRPKQFSRIYGGRSLLAHTKERLRPVFLEDRTLFVVTKFHEAFYMEELSDADSSRILAQPSNRGIGVAVILALLRVLRHGADAVVAFFPSDHYFANDAAFTATVRSAVGLARKHAQSVILVGVESRWPEVEYGWIEPGAIVNNGDETPLFRVNRFWEKPTPSKARELMRKRGLWNTFVTIGQAGAFLELLFSTIPGAMAEIAAALARDDLERIYGEMKMIDFSKDVLSAEPRRLLVIPEASSGWTDLGKPDRVIETLVENEIEPEWLREMLDADVPAAHDLSRAQALQIPPRRPGSMCGMSNHE